jgi:pimeloyl-ACP methyl ester carboxylesterase
MPEVEGVRHRDVVVDGVRLHVAEAGEGPAVVLQHGWPQNWWAWRELIGPLSASHRVICPDLRGLGWSEAPRDGYDKERMASDLLGVLDALELQRVRLVGHDWGGFAGFLACLRAPERFSGYLALAISHPWPPGGGGAPDPRRLARLWYQFVLAAPVVGGELIRRPGVARQLLTRAGAGAWDEQALDVYAERLSGDGGSRATVGIYRTFLTRELVPMVRGRYSGQRLVVPTRLLIGERDPVITPDSLEGYAEHADDMTVEIVPGAGHWLPEERPERVLEAIAALP